MSKRIYLMLVLLIALSASVVAQVRYCLSYEDFKNDKWVTLDDSVTVTLENTGGLGDLSFKTGDKDMDKLLKKEVRFIVYNDVLFVNNRKLKGKGVSLGKNYTQAFRYGKDSVCVVGPRSVKGGKVALYFAGNLAANLLLVPLTGTSVIVAPTKEAKPVCYLMTSDKRKLSMITDNYMEQLLADKSLSESLYKYKNEEKKKRETADVILKYLFDLNLLKPY